MTAGSGPRRPRESGARISNPSSPVGDVPSTGGSSRPTSAPAWPLLEAGRSAWSAPAWPRGVAGGSTGTDSRGSSTPTRLVRCADCAEGGTPGSRTLAGRGMSAGGTGSDLFTASYLARSGKTGLPLGTDTSAVFCGWRLSLIPAACRSASLKSDSGRHR